MLSSNHRPSKKVCGEVFPGRLSTHDQRHVPDWMISQPRLVVSRDGLHCWHHAESFRCSVFGPQGGGAIDEGWSFDQWVGKFRSVSVFYSLYHVSKTCQDSLLTGYNMFSYFSHGFHKFPGWDSARAHRRSASIGLGREKLWDPVIDCVQKLRERENHWICLLEALSICMSWWNTCWTIVHIYTAFCSSTWILHHGYK